MFQQNIYPTSISSRCKHSPSRQSIQ